MKRMVPLLQLRVSLQLPAKYPRSLFAVNDTRADESRLRQEDPAKDAESDGDAYAPPALRSVRTRGGRRMKNDRGTARCHAAVVDDQSPAERWIRLPIPL